MASPQNRLFAALKMASVAVFATAQMAAAQSSPLPAAELPEKSAVDICQQTKKEYLKARLGTCSQKTPTPEMKKLSEEYEARCKRNPTETTRKLRGQVLLLILSNGLRR